MSAAAAARRLTRRRHYTIIYIDCNDAGIRHGAVDSRARRTRPIAAVAAAGMSSMRAPLLT